MKNLKFLHLPKTAGTSVRVFLSGFFPAEEVCPASFAYQLRALPADQLRTYRMFAGHYDWVDLDRIAGPCFTFTVLRDPLERVLSFYFSMRARALQLQNEPSTQEKRPVRVALELSPDEFFGSGGAPLMRRHLDNQLDNFYTYYFAGRSAKTRQRRSVRGISEADLLSMANRNLDRLDGLYSTEDLGPLKRDMIAHFGGRDLGVWRTVRARLYPIQRIKRNHRRGHVASRIDDLKSLGATSRTFERLEEMTRLDRIIWAQRFGRAGEARAAL